MARQRVAPTLVALAALASVGHASAQTHDLATAVANMTRFCLASLKASDMGLSPAGLQAFCRCSGIELGRRISLAELTGPATPKFDTVARAVGKDCYTSLPAGARR